MTAGKLAEATFPAVQAVSTSSQVRSILTSVTPEAGGGEARSVFTVMSGVDIVKKLQLASCLAVATSIDKTGMKKVSIIELKRKKRGKIGAVYFRPTPSH